LLSHPIERIAKTHRYHITEKGLRAAIFYTRLYNRGLAIVSSHVAASELPMAAAIRAVKMEVELMVLRRFGAEPLIVSIERSRRQSIEPPS
jgi:hypothetical protein